MSNPTKAALSVVEQAETAHPAAGVNTKLDMKYLVRALIKYNASDLHLKPGRPPLFRINGKLVSAKMDPLAQDQIDWIVKNVLSRRHHEMLEERRQVDFSFHVQESGRFRCNVYYQRGALSAAVRMIPLAIPKLEDLGVPLVLKDLAQRKHGLVLITGATGVGKSTTLAGMIQFINENSSVHILTIEDPIEFLYRDVKAAVSQREVGSDTHSFKEGLHAGLRQDPDVIMIGELRDCETMQAALSAAETGHLVLSTLHTNDAKGTLDRILDMFPSDAQAQVRVQLASSLIAIVSQQLVIRTDVKGRVPVCEVLVKSPVIENYILKNELDRIPEAMATSTSYYNMQTMNQALEKLVNAGTISLEEAIKASNNPDDLKLRLSGVARDEGYEMMTSTYTRPQSSED